MYPQTQTPADNTSNQSKRKNVLTTNQNKSMVTFNAKPKLILQSTLPKARNGSKTNTWHYISSSTLMVMSIEGSSLVLRWMQPWTCFDSQLVHFFFRIDLMYFLLAFLGLVWSLICSCCSSMSDWHTRLELFSSLWI